MNTSGKIRTGEMTSREGCTRGLRGGEMLARHLVAAVTIVAAFAVIGCSGEPTETNKQDLGPAGTSQCFAISEFGAGLPRSRGWRTNPSLADVDGDGDLDLAATTRKGQEPTVFLFSPDGWQQQTVSLGGVPCGVGVELTDLTADGLVDLLVADHCLGLFMFKGDGKGTFAPLAKMGTPAGEGFNDAAAGDLDGDGLLDIVALGSFSRGYTLFMGEAPGQFAPRKSSLPRKGYGWEVNLHDLNGDGRLDIYGTLQGFRPEDGPGGARAGKIWLQEEGGVWTQAPRFPERGNWFGMARGDFDEDGRPDFALSNHGDHEGGIRIYRATSDGAWEETGHIGAAQQKRYAGVAVTDMDGDGHQDVVAVEYRGPTVVVWLGDGKGSFAECSDRPPPIDRIDRPGWGIAAGDIDRDGNIEVVAGFGSEVGGVLKAWTFKPTGKRPASPPVSEATGAEQQD